LALAETGISARQDRSHAEASIPPRNINRAVTNSTTQPVTATGSAIGTNENIVTSTPDGAARPAISRLELVPISIVDPASVA